jgi:hypothetical protein
MPQDEITSHIASLKALTSALERTYSTDTEEESDDAQQKNCAQTRSCAVNRQSSR